jgi:adenylate cyclase
LPQRRHGQREGRTLQLERDWRRADERCLLRTAPRALAPERAPIHDARMSRLVAATAIAIATSAVVAGLHALGGVGRLELLARDARINSGIGRDAPGSDIVVAWIDQDGIDYVRRELQMGFPWPRSVYRDVLGYLKEAGAKAVAFDLLFTEPSGNDDEDFAGALKETAGDVLAFKFVEFRDGGFTPPEDEAMAAAGLSVATSASLTPARGFVLPIPELATAVDRLGFVNITADADKVNRSYDLLRTWRGKAYPSLALATAMVATGTPTLNFDGTAVQLGERRIPVDARGSMQLEFRGGPLTFENTKFVNILLSASVEPGQQPLYPKERFRDKIVLVAVNAEGYADVVPAPVSLNYPGVELHATALDNLLRGDPLRRLDHDLWFGLGGAVAGVAAVFALPGAVLPALALAALLAVLVGIGFWLFAGGLLIPLAAPTLGMLLAGAGSFVWRVVFEGQKRREMRRAFTSYMAPEVVAEVLKNPDAIHLGGETRHVTLVFTDLAGFTGLAEHMQPQELVAFLNDYFTRMCDRVLAERGVIDKFIGDAIMAMFGAPVNQPDHPARAARAALGMLAEMEQINAELRAAGKPTVLTRIGVHSGLAVVGNMGSSKRFDYTAIGDTVNLASRLEGANKAFGTLCMVSETAWAANAGQVIGRELGRVRVKGREQPITVYEPLALASGAVDQTYLDAYARAVAALRARQLPEAKRLFGELHAQRPEDGLVAYYCEKLADPSWDGVFSLDSK